MLPALRQRVSRSLWDLHRFGLTPSKLASRLSTRAAPRVLVVSLPKAGTHLVERALCLHPWLYRRVQRTVTDRNLHRFGGFERLLERLAPGQIAVTHLTYDEQRAELLRRSDVLGLLVVRDPRDVAVSLAHYVSSRRDHPNHRHFASLRTHEERLRRAIEGAPEGGLPSMADRLDQFSGWLEGNLLTLRFEELVGARGGESAEIQRRALRELFDYLGVPRAEPLLGAIQERLFSAASPTFRRGSTGQWRQDFSPELKALFLARCGHLLESYGYGER